MIISPDGNAMQSATINARGWFSGEPEVVKRYPIPVIEHWKCPEIGCDGYMIFTGQIWPTSNPGHHHDCNKCGAAWAIHGAPYPRLVWEDKPDGDAGLPV